jgi:5-methylcytosine-specific restriction endonuclease McrA
MKLSRNLDAEALADWRRKVLANAAYVCELCRAATAVEAHHVVTRAIHSLRYDTKNGMALCRTCHMVHHDKSPQAVNLALLAHRPADAAYLEKMRRSIRKYGEEI